MQRLSMLGYVIVGLIAVGSVNAQSPGLQGAALKDRTAEVKKKIDAEYTSLESLYKHLHSNPELSLQELQTADRLAKELKSLGFEVTEKFGGTGVVGVLKNGKGPTVLVRTDMDALPIVEATGVPYASKVQVRDKNGNPVGVMHACGHDMHMTTWTGTARVLAALKDRWQGTLVFIAQPAEEIGQGAKAMLAAGLYEKFPRPDYCFALHCDSHTPHGQLSYTEGFALANVDTLDILVKGKGGHGSTPNLTIDPVVLAARIVLDLQTIVSRERDPFDPVVVTVGSIHGGTKHNIIPPDVKLQLTIRTTKDKSRKEVIDAIGRIARAAALGARAPEPIIKHDATEFTPATYNDPALTRRTATMLQEAMGAENVKPRQAVLGGEDFGRYALSGDKKVPIFLFWLGTVPAERLKAGAEPLSLHSDGYYPVPEPSIKTGVLGMSLAVLNLMGK
jgi:amidohydrolase